MNGGEKTYRTDDGVFTIPEKESASFLKDFPKAEEVQSFTIEKDTFDIPVTEVSEFLQENPKAAEVKKKEQSESISEPFSVGDSTVSLSPSPSKSDVSDVPSLYPTIEAATPETPPYFIDGQPLSREEFKSKLYEDDFINRMRTGTVKMDYPADEEMHGLIKRQVESGSEAGDKWDYFMSGLYDMAAGVAGMQSYANNILRETLKPLGVEVPKGLMEMMSETSADALKFKARQEIEKTRQYEEGFLNSIGEGNYSDAANQAFNVITQSLPVSIAAAATGGTAGAGTGLATLGGIVSSSEYAGSDEYENLSNAEKIFRSTAIGTAEAAGELVTGGILNKNFQLLKSGLKNQVKKAAQIGGEQAAQQVASQISERTAKEIFKEYGIDILREAGSEGLTELAQMGTDDMMGVRNYELSDYITQGLEATALGAVGGSVMGLPTASKGVKRFADEKLRENQGEDLKAKVDQRVEQKITTPQQGEEIKSAIDSRVEAVNAVPENIVGNTEVVDLVQEKQGLEEEKKSLDPIFQPPVEEKIEKVDAQIREKTGIPQEEKPVAEAAVKTEEITPSETEKPEIKEIPAAEEIQGEVKTIKESQVPQEALSKFSTERNNPERKFIPTGEIIKDAASESKVKPEQFIKAFAESDLPKKAFGKRDKIEHEFLPDEDINVKPIEQKINPVKDETVESKRATLKNIVGGDETRPAMKGVLHDAENKVLVATDAHKMIIVPDKSIKKTEIISPEGEKIDAKFPNYQAVIPESQPYKQKINVKEWLDETNGLARTASFFDKAIHAKIKIGDNEFYFEPKFLNDVLKVFADNGVKEVEIGLDKPNRAMVLKGDGITGLVMPKMGDVNTKAKTIFEREINAKESEVEFLQSKQRIEQQIASAKGDIADYKKILAEDKSGKKKLKEAGRDYYADKIDKAGKYIEDLQEQLKILEDEQRGRISGTTETRPESTEPVRATETGESTELREPDETEGEPTREQLLEEDLKAFKFPSKITVSEKEFVRGKGTSSVSKVVFPEQSKTLKESLAEAVKNPSSKSYDKFYDAFVKAYESPFKGSDAVKKLWTETMRAFPEIESWRKKEEEIKRRFTTPVIHGSGISLGIPLKVMPKELWQKYVKKEGDIPLRVFNEWIKTKGAIASHLKQIEFTRGDFQKALRKAYGATWLRTPKVKVENLEKINDVLERLGTENRDAVLSELPEPLRDVVAQMRDEIDALSRELMRSGFIDEKLATKIQDNLGFYMTRSYRLHTDKGWNWEKIPDEIKIKAAKVLADKFPDKSVEQIEGILKSYVNNRDVAWDFARGGTLGSKDLGVTKQRKDIPIEIREFLGQFKDPVYNYATSIAKMANLVEKHKFLENVLAEGKDKWLFDQQVGDYNVKIAAEGSKTLEPLNGLYTTKEIAEAFKKFADSDKNPDWLRLYMAVNSIVKYSKTILSPKTHARNFGSNFLFQVANGRFDLQAGAKTVSTVANYLKNKNSEEFREYYKDLVARGVIDESVHANELRQNIQSSIDYIHDFEKYGDNLLKKISGKSLRAIEKAYMLEDNVHKIYAYETEKSRYMDVFKDEEKASQEAAKIVRLTMPTYSEVPLFIRNLRKFPLTGTFVTFPYEVLRNSYNTVWLTRKEFRDLQTRSIGAQRLVGLMTAATITAGISLATRAMLGLGEDDEKDIRRFLPDWSKNSDLLYIKNNGEGKYTYLDMGYSDPYNYVKKPFNAVVKGDRNKDLIDAAVEFVKPFLGEELLASKVIDLTRNTRADGRQVWNPEAPYGERWTAMVNHLLGAVEPGAVTDAKRIYKAYKKKTDEFSTTAENEILGVATGQRVQGVDFGKSYLFKVKKSGTSIYDAVSIFTSVLYNKESSDEDKEKAYKTASESLNHVMSEARQDYLAALNLGVPEKKLKDIVDKLYIEKFRANRWIKNAIILGTKVQIEKDTGKIIKLK